MQKFDLLIVNTGIAGLILASGLSKYYCIAIINQHSDMNSVKICSLRHVKQASFINVTSIRILKYLNIWNDNIKYILNIIYGLEITKKSIIFDIEQIIFESGYLGYLELGYVVDYHILQHELINHLKTLNTITFLGTLDLLKTIVYHQNEVIVTLNNNATCVVKLVIGADGANSWIRKNAGIPLIFEDSQYYGSTTVVYTEKKHKNIIRYIVCRDKTVILFPLLDSHLSFAFWLLPDRVYHQRYIYKFRYNNPYDRDLSCIRNILGNVTLLNNETMNIFPLRTQYTYDFVKHRLILLGEAAYVRICPLVFHNINTEFLDAVILCDYLIQLQKYNKDIGHCFYLKPYYGNTANTIFQIITKAIPYTCIYQNSNLLEYTQFIVFYLLKLLPSYKNYILRYIMGLDNVPPFLLKNKNC